MSKACSVLLGTLALALASAMGRADTRTIPLSPDEHWWGLGAAWADKMPITRGSRPFVADLAASNDVRTVVSLLVSDRGRYVWCEPPASFTVTEDALTVKAEGSAVELKGEYLDLRDAFRGVLRDHGLEKGRDPLELLSVYAPGGEKAAIEGRQPSSPGRDAFLARMKARADELGMVETRLVNPSGLTKDSRSSANDLLRLGLAFADHPVLARIWGTTNHMVKIEGPNARRVNVTHNYVALKNFGAFTASYPFLGGKGGSLNYPDLKIRAHVLVTEVGGVRYVISIMGMAFVDDPFALDLEICAQIAAEQRGEKPPAAPAIAALLAKGGGYAYSSLDRTRRYASPNADRSQVPASTTKIMTALCTVETVKDLSQKLTVCFDDLRGGSGIECHSGDVLTYEEALYALLLSSSNTLAEALAASVGELLISR